MGSTLGNWTPKRSQKCEVEVWLMQKTTRCGSSNILADLPRERLVERVFPFANTGLECFRPFEVRFMRKPIKRWWFYSYY